MTARLPKFTIALLLLALLTPQAHTKTPPHFTEFSVSPNFISASDPLDLIVAKMIRWGELSQDLGKLAEAKGYDEEVRRYGQRLRRDHKLLNRKLKDFAKAEALVLDLQGLKSPTLDGMYKLREELQEDVSPDIPLTSFYSTHLSDLDRCLRLLKEQSSHPGLASLIDSHTAILSQHLQLARHLEDSSL